MKLTKSTKFSWIIAQLLIICILGMLSGCKGKEEVKGAPPEVIVTAAFSKNVTETLQVVGQIVPKESADLVARVRGFLIKRLFHEGSFVRKGELLFQIERTEYEANVESAEAKLDTAKANYKNDSIDYERQKYLANKNAVAQRIYEKASAQKAISAASILSANAALKEAKLQLSYTDVISPYNGRIGLAKYSVGNVVGNFGSSNDSLARVVMVDPIQVEFNITESFITTLLQEMYKGKRRPDPKSNKKPSVKDVVIKLILSNGTEYPKEGSIDFMDNVINPMTGTITLRAIFKNPKAILIPGAYVMVKLQERKKVDALLIPQAAIQDDQTGKYVMYVNEKNEATKRNITVGSIYSTDIVVLSGLKKGDRVIREGLQKVREGIVVNPIIKKEEMPKEQKKTNANPPGSTTPATSTTSTKNTKPEQQDSQNSKPSTPPKLDKAKSTAPVKEEKPQKKNTNQG